MNLFLRGRLTLRNVGQDERLEGKFLADTPLGTMLYKPSENFAAHQICMDYCSGEIFICFSFFI